MTMMSKAIRTGLLAATATLALESTEALAAGKGKPNCPDDNDSRCDTTTVPAPTSTFAGNSRDAIYQDWMHVEVPVAWGASATADGGYEYLGQGVSLTFVDDFSSSSAYAGDFGDGSATLRHGEWTSKEGGMIAPHADLYLWDFSNGGYAVPKQNTGLNVFNASYGWIETPGAFTVLDAQEQSLVDFAAAGTAVVVKSAGNTSGTAVGDANVTLVFGKGPPRNVITYDYFALGMIGAAASSSDTFSGIFVGALDGNSTNDWVGTEYTGEKVGIASYSTVAGTNTVVQDHFLVVGVRNDLTGLAGTSFAAPIISGYAAILGSKFTTASATDVANQLLSTTRTVTLIDIGAAGYGDEDRAVYGMGEACLICALSPTSISFQ